MLKYFNSKKAILGKNNGLVISTIFIFFSILFFDSLISSNSIYPFRLIFDIAFIMILSVITYVSVLLQNNKEINENYLVFIFPKISFIIPIMLNLKAVISTSWLSDPLIGHLNKNMLFQNVISLFPLLDFLLIMTVNGTILYIVINKSNAISIYKIPIYILCVIAIESFLVNYFYHISGIKGVCLGLSLFHVGFCSISYLLFYKYRIREVRLKISFSDVLLLLLSIGIFLMVYFRQGVYLIFTDNTVVTASTMSMIFRESLNPYYMSAKYYSPIGGFVSIVFAFICGVDNILLASILPFYVGHLLLPFIAYHFLKICMTDDSRIAIIGVVMSLLMDGLAVVLLPSYVGNLTPNSINWLISPATKSLYNSSLQWLFLKPFNNLGMASALATCCFLFERKKVSLLLGSTLFFLSFVNPRQPYLTVLLLIYMFGINRINLKEIGILGSATIVSCGPIFTPILYVVIKAIMVELRKTNLITEELLNQNLTLIKPLIENPLLLILGSLVALILLLSLESKSIDNTEHYTCQFKEKIKKIYIKLPKNPLGLSIMYQDVLFLGIIGILLIYIIFYAYGWLHPILVNFVETPLVAPLNYIVIRYHVLIVLIIISTLEIKYNLRVLATSIILVIFAYLGVLSDTFPLHVPTVFVVLALPVFQSYVKNRRKIMIIIVLSFVFLGFISASLYSANANTIESDPRITDLPYILRILLNKDHKENVFTPSHVYYVKRTLQMANIKQPIPSENSSSNIYLIDNLMTSKPKTMWIEQLLNNDSYKLLYDGEGFSLLEKVAKSIFINTMDASRVNPSEVITLNDKLEGITMPIKSVKSSLSFDGGNDYIRVEHSPSLNLGNNFTIITWIKPGETRTVKSILVKGGVNDIRYGLGTTNGNKFRFMLHDLNGNLQWFGSSTSFEVNKWYFVAVTFNKPTAVIYINGIPDRVCVLDFNITNSYDWLAIGRAGVKSSMYFKGLIDELRIYNSTFSNKEIIDAYRGIYNNEVGPVLYMNFDGDVQDRSGYGNNGTIYGGIWTTEGFVNMNIKVELDGNLVQKVNIINATDDSYKILNIVTPNYVDVYKYTIYNYYGYGEKQIKIIVDKIKITEGGLINFPKYVGQKQTIWFNAIYEYDNKEFNDTNGILYLNGTSLKWSRDNRRWEYTFVPNEPGRYTYEITGIRDMVYNLTSINDTAGSITVYVKTHWYDPLNIGLSNPLLWVDIGVFIFINICFYFCILGFHVKQNMQLN